MASSQNLTQLLVAWSNGNLSARDQLALLVQEELQIIARKYLRNEIPGHLLETTALVNEAWLRLIDWRNVSWQNRAHFFSVAAQLMRRVLIDEARQRQAAKRGGDLLRISLATQVEIAAPQSVDLLDLDAAVQKLAALDQRKSQIVEFRFFGDLTVEEIAEVLGISVRTVIRDWEFAKTWLFRELTK